MSQVELIWGAFSLMLLGALVTMCMKCHRSGSRKEQTLASSRRNRCENQQRCEDPECSISVSREECAEIPHSRPKPSKGRKRPASTSRQDGGCAEPRYQNLGKGTQMVEQEYIEPLHSDYYNCRNFLRPPREQDSCSYQNVARPLRNSGCVLAEVGIYENSLAFQLQKSPQTSESSEDDEPDYINAEVDPNSFPV